MCTTNITDEASFISQFMILDIIAIENQPVVNNLMAISGEFIFILFVCRPFSIEHVIFFDMFLIGLFNHIFIPDGSVPMMILLAQS